MVRTCWIVREHSYDAPMVFETEDDAREFIRLKGREGDSDTTVHEAVLFPSVPAVASFKVTPREGGE